MTAASPRAGTAEAEGPRRLNLAFTGSPEGVRGALADLRTFLRGAALDEDAAGTAEIVLAEVLNNVAEHAYEMRGEGKVSLAVALNAHHLSIDVTDAGAPLPGLDLPAGHPPRLDSECDLPEGGFGWFLIHQLTSALHYHRVNGCNHLHLELTFET